MSVAPPSISAIIIIIIIIIFAPIAILAPPCSLNQPSGPYRTFRIIYSTPSLPVQQNPAYFITLYLIGMNYV